MTYKVILHESEEGFAVSCPALPGCWSQGAAEEEAAANIRDAIREYLAATAAKRGPASLGAGPLALPGAA